MIKIWSISTRTHIKMTLKLGCEKWKKRNNQARETHITQTIMNVNISHMIVKIQFHFVSFSISISISISYQQTFVLNRISPLACPLDKQSHSYVICQMYLLMKEGVNQQMKSHQKEEEQGSLKGQEE